MRDVWNGLSKEAKCIAILLGYGDTGATVTLHYTTRRWLDVTFGESVVTELIDAGIINFVL